VVEPGAGPMGPLFLLLGGLFTLIALHPRWRRSWRWGRSGSGPPLSAVGWLGWIGAFYGIAAAGFGWIHPVWVVVAFILVIAAGVWDSLHDPAEPAQGWGLAAGWLALGLLLGAAGTAAFLVLQS
jgi:hypothetical protein